MNIVDCLLNIFVSATFIIYKWEFVLKRNFGFNMIWVAMYVDLFNIFYSSYNMASYIYGSL